MPNGLVERHAPRPPVYMHFVLLGDSAPRSLALHAAAITRHSPVLLELVVRSPATERTVSVWLAGLVQVLLVINRYKGASDLTYCPATSWSWASVHRHSARREPAD